MIIVPSNDFDQLQKRFRGKGELKGEMGEIQDLVFKFSLHSFSPFLLFSPHFS
jgi:hypothetical protein